MTTKAKTKKKKTFTVLPYYVLATRGEKWLFAFIYRAKASIWKYSSLSGAFILVNVLKPRRNVYVDYITYPATVVDILIRGVSWAFAVGLIHFLTREFPSPQP